MYDCKLSDYIGGRVRNEIVVVFLDEHHWILQLGNETLNEFVKSLPVSVIVFEVTDRNFHDVISMTILDNFLVKVFLHPPSSCCYTFEFNVSVVGIVILNRFEYVLHSVVLF
jgi:hypothetical protein